MTVLWILLILLAILLLLILVSLLRTLLIPSRKSAYDPAPDPERAEAYARKLSAMVRYETVSVPGEDQREKFLGFHKVLEELFPLVHRTMEKTEIDGTCCTSGKGRKATGRWC